MALNCPIGQNGQPNKVEGETLLIYRDFVEMEVKMDGVGKRTAKGKVFLSTLRLVFVSDKQDSDFKSFDIPIRHLLDEDIVMPIFGNTYLKGSVKPLFGLLPGNSHFKLWFYNGKTHTFIKFLSRVIELQRKQQIQTAVHPNLQQMAMGNYDRKAFVDPEDPTFVYI